MVTLKYTQEDIFEIIKTIYFIENKKVLTSYQTDLVIYFIDEYINFLSFIDSFISKEMFFSQKNSIFIMNEIFFFNMKYNKSFKTVFRYYSKPNSKYKIILDSNSFSDNLFKIPNINISCMFKDKAVIQSIKKFMLNNIEQINNNFKNEIKSSFEHLSYLKSIFNLFLFKNEDIDFLLNIINNNKNNDTIEIKEFLLLKYDIDIADKN